MANELELIPFGKYKGKPVETLSADPSYCEWLANQDWFRERYAKVYNVIINNFKEPQDSPEHNKIQVLFLQKDFLTLLVPHIISKEEFISTAADQIETCDWYMENHKPNRSGFFEDSAERKERLEAEIELIKNGDYSFFDVDCIEFEDCGVDVKLRVHSKDIAESFCIEIKPCVGDDYPTILRQIKANWKAKENRFYDHYCLLYDQFSAVGISEPDMVALFNHSGIIVIKLKEIQELGK